MEWISSTGGQYEGQVKTWETTIGEMYGGGTKNLGADLSYVAELLGKNATDAERDQIVTLLRDYINSFDKMPV